MSVQSVKGFLWVGSLLVGGGLAYTVSDFLRHQEELEQVVSTEEQERVLLSIVPPEPPKDNVVDYKAVSKGFHQLNWTGKVDRPPPPVAVVDQEIRPRITPVSELLRVLFVQVDMRGGKDSLAFVSYTDPRLRAAAELGTNEEYILRMEEHLAAPYGDVRVARIEVDGVTFAFDDEERESEVVATVPFPTQRGGIVKVGPEGALVVQRQQRIFAGPNNQQPYRPEKTQQVGKNEFLIGTSTIEDVNANYSEILSRDVGYRTHRNPKTGQVDGIEITRVKGDSLVSQHGIEEGEVLKSINGHPVKTVNEAIAFVKSEADHTETWIAVFEKRGKEFTRVYRSPPE